MSRDMKRLIAGLAIVLLLIVALVYLFPRIKRNSAHCPKVVEREIEHGKYELDLSNGQEVKVSRRVFNSHPVDSTYCK